MEQKQTHVASKMAPNWNALSSAIDQSNPTAAIKALNALWQQTREIEFITNEGKQGDEYTPTGADFVKNMTSALTAAIARRQEAVSDDNKAQADYVMRLVFNLWVAALRKHPDLRKYFETDHALNNQLQDTIAKMPFSNLFQKNEQAKLLLVENGLGFSTNFYDTGRPFDLELVFHSMAASVLSQSPRTTKALAGSGWTLPKGAEELDGMQKAPTKKGPNAAYLAYIQAKGPSAAQAPAAKFKKPGDTTPPSTPPKPPSKSLWERFTNS